MLGLSKSTIIELIKTLNSTSQIFHRAVVDSEIKKFLSLIDEFKAFKKDYVEAKELSNKSKELYLSQMKIVENIIYERFCHAENPNQEIENQMLKDIEKGKENETVYIQSIKYANDNASQYEEFCKGANKDLEDIAKNISNGFSNCVQILYSSILKKNVLESQYLSEFNDNFSVILKTQEKQLNEQKKDIQTVIIPELKFEPYQISFLSNPENMDQTKFMTIKKMKDNFKSIAEEVIILLFIYIYFSMI